MFRNILLLIIEFVVVTVEWSVGCILLVRLKCIYDAELHTRR